MLALGECLYGVLRPSLVQTHFKQRGCLKVFSESSNPVLTRMPSLNCTKPSQTEIDGDKPFRGQLWVRVSSCGFLGVESAPQRSSKQVAHYSPDNQATCEINEFNVEVFRWRCMPTVGVVPSPECRNRDHRHAKTQDTGVEDEMPAALGANSLRTLYLHGSLRDWL